MDNTNISNLGEVTLNYKYHNPSIKDRPLITNASDAVEVIKLVIDMQRIALQDQFIVIYLNQANKVIGTMNVFSGSIKSTVIDIKLILASGILLMSSGVIVAHNHPSGNLKPSREDLALTKRLSTALQYMEMKLVDHFIITPDDDYLSFANEGLL
jgi:DNA repair protein RadC